VNAFHNKLLSSQNIVLAGGGPVGVELAADIKLRYPEKR
jgi:NADH dehydrogenase FAD-containing subunit